MGAIDLVEALLLALELAEATTVGAETTTATTTTAVAKATAAAATTSSTSTAEATTSTVISAGGGVVDADSTALNLLTVQCLKGSSGLVNRAEVDVTEALERTSVTVGGKRDTGNVAVLSEDLLDTVVAAVEGQVSEEEGVGRSTALVAVFVGTSALVRLLTRSAEVDVERATVKLILVHLSLSLGGIGSAGKLDVTETLGAATFAVGDDTAAGDVTEALEFATKPGLVNVPAQAANEQVRDTLGCGSFSLGLLDSGLSCGLGLALVGGCLLFLAVGVGGVVRVGSLYYIS
jgi:hypothetical protein